ncbi:MAG: GNVR domain-containing protein [Myxococcota bacterium]
MTDRSGRRRPELAPVQPAAPSAPPPVAPAEAAGLHAFVLGRLGDLRRHIVLVAVVWLMVVGAAGAYAVLAVPTYASVGVVQVGGSAVPSLHPLADMAGVGGNDQLDTEVQVLQRRDFLLEVFKGQGLHVVDPTGARWLSTDTSITLEGERPTASGLLALRRELVEATLPAGRFNPLTVELRAEDETHLAVLTDPQGAAAEHTLVVGEPLETDALRLHLRGNPLAVGESVRVEVVPDGALLEDLLPRLSVGSLGRARERTNLVEVRFSDPDRYVAQAVVEGVMTHYVEQSLRWQTQGAGQAASFIRERLEEAQTRLSGQEEGLRDFASGQQAVQLDTQARVTIESSAEIRAEQLSLDLQLRVLDTLSAGLARSGSKGRAHLTANLVEDPVLGAAIASLTEAETQHAVLAATLTADHPRVIELAAKIGLRQKEVSRLVSSAKKSLRARRAELGRRLEQTDQAMAAYPDKELQLARLVRDVEVSQRLYAFLLEKSQDAEILQASSTTDKRVVDRASLPHRQATPNRLKLVGGAGLGGLLLAMIAVSLRQLLRRRVGTADEVQRLSGLATYGTVPKIRRGRGQPPRLRPTELWDDATHPAAEAFRALCVSVSLSPGQAERGRVVQVSSSQAGEGKSTVAANLAHALAATGRRVLLLDLDLRRPVQHRLWAARRVPGYSDAVGQGGTPDVARSMLQQPGDDGPALLSAGTPLPDTLASLMSPSLGRLLDHWVERYDDVIVDGPPAFVADAAILAQHADLVLLVARPDMVERAALRNAVAALHRVDAAKGLVLNGVTRRDADYSYYHSRYDDTPSGEHRAAS